MQSKTGKIWLLFLAVLLTAALWGGRAEAADASLCYDTADIHDGTVGQPYEAEMYFYCYETVLDSFEVIGQLPDGLTAEMNALESTLIIRGTPAKAGTFSFQLKAVGTGGTQDTSTVQTVRIAPADARYTVSVAGGKALHEGGSAGTDFMAGELVRVADFAAQDQYAIAFSSVPAMTIPTGGWYSRAFGLGSYFFYMPAENVSITPLLGNKDLGSITHNAAGQGTETDCSVTLIATISYAEEMGLIDLKADREDFSANPIDRGDFVYYRADLDGDGTYDLEIRRVFHRRWTVAEFYDSVKALPGRSVYGTYTLELPVDRIYKECDTGLYSKVIFNMEEKAPETQAEKTEPATQAPETEPATQAPGTTEAPASSAAAQTSAQAPSTAPAPTANQGGGSGGSSNTLLIVLIVILALIAGILGGVLIGKKK